MFMDMIISIIYVMSCLRENNQLPIPKAIYGFQSFPDKFDCNNKRLRRQIQTKKKKQIRNVQFFEMHLRDKGIDLTQSYDKSPYTDRKIQKAT